MTFRHCDAQQHTDRGWVPNPEVKVRILRPVFQTHRGQIFSKGEIHSYPIIYWRTSKAVCKENSRTSCVCSSMVSLTMSLRAELAHPGKLGSTVWCLLWLGTCNFIAGRGQVHSYLWEGGSQWSITSRLIDMLSKRDPYSPEKAAKLQTLMHTSYGLCLLLMETSRLWREGEIRLKRSRLSSSTLTALSWSVRSEPRHNFE